MMAGLELWLIRHGETDWRRDGESRIAGPRQIPLSQKGREQAKALGEVLKAHAFDVVYASDLDRALQTAKLALPDAAITPDKRLRETNSGVFEGKTVAEFTSEEREMFEAWRQNPYGVKRGGGESWLDVETRMVDWLTSLPAEGKVAAFSHTGAIQVLLHWLLGVPRNDRCHLSVDFTGLTKILAKGERYRILALNHTAHLRADERLSQ